MNVVQRLNNRYLLTMREVCEVTGMSDDSIRREMRKGLPSRLQNGRRFLTTDVVKWFRLDASEPEPAKSFAPIRITEDSAELPQSLTRRTARRAA